MPNDVKGFQVGDSIIPYAKPDYDQNDSTAPDYIKNRPFYDNTPDGELKKIDKKYLPDMLPEVTAADAGKILTVNNNGEWEAVSVTTLEGTTFNLVAGRGGSDTP